MTVVGPVCYELLGENRRPRMALRGRASLLLHGLQGEYFLQSPDPIGLGQT